MKWVEMRVVFEAAAPGQVEELIADAFLSAGLSGVLIEDPRQTPKEGWGPGAGPSRHHAVVGYLPLDERLQRRQKTLQASLARLAEEIAFRYRVQRATVDEEDWSESWKTYFQPLRVTDRVVIKPTWRSFDPGPGDVVLELDPGMAFGTGSHATTAMCIQLLERYLFPGATLLDVGTGSGILLVAGGKLGAGRMVGIDHDPVAAAIARKNLRLNGIGPDRCGMVVGNLTAAVRGEFDVILANILAEVILPLLDGLQTLLAPGGTLVCSGIIESKMLPVQEKLTTQGFRILSVARQEEWVALAARRP
jgi:ribosomal protein L11 methyltransferase